MGIDVPLTVEETDGSPSVKAVRKIKLGTNLSLADDGRGVVTVASSPGTGVIGGSIAEGQVAFGSATADEIEGLATFKYDKDTNVLTLGPDASSDPAKLRFYDDANKATLSASGSSFHILNNNDASMWRSFNGGVRINDGGNDINFQIYRDGNNDRVVFNTRADNGRVGIGDFTETTWPDTRLHILATDGDESPVVRIEDQNTSLTEKGPIVELYRNADLESGDAIGSLRWNALDADGNNTDYIRLDGMISDETAGGEDGELILRMREANAVTEFMRWRGASRQVEVNATGDDIDWVYNSDKVMNLVFLNAGDDSIIFNQDHDTDFGTFEVRGHDSGDGIIYYPSSDTLMFKGGSSGTTLQLFSLGDGAAEHPVLDMYTRNATDAGDKLGRIQFTARPDGSGSEVTKAFAYVDGLIQSNGPGGGDYDGQLKLSVLKNNTMQDALVMDGKNGSSTGVAAVMITDGDMPLEHVKQATQYSSPISPIPASYLYGGCLNLNMSDAADRTCQLPAGLKGMSVTIQDYGSQRVIIQAAADEFLNGTKDGTYTGTGQYAIFTAFCYADGYWSVGGDA